MNFLVVLLEPLLILPANDHSSSLVVLSLALVNGRLTGSATTTQIGLTWKIQSLECWNSICLEYPTFVHFYNTNYAISSKLTVFDPFSPRWVLISADSMAPPRRSFVPDGWNSVRFILTRGTTMELVTHGRIRRHSVPSLLLIPGKFST